MDFVFVSFNYSVATNTTGDIYHYFSEFFEYLHTIILVWIKFKSEYSYILTDDLNFRLEQ